ncbi:MAG TPA: hypothetical protein VMU32_02895 [Solirubrobacteraceae bacterium]|nr:hypothetical protein [Solirubrobacteraceae bacterium]
MDVKETVETPAGETATAALVAAFDQAEAQLRQASTELERARAAALEQTRSEGADLGELTDAANVPREAVVAFVRTAAKLLGGHRLSVQAAERAAVLATAAQAWEGELGPLLSSAQVRTLLGGVSRQRVDELLRTRRLIGLRDDSGRRRFPAFQFLDGRPLESLVDAYWAVASAAVSEWTAAAWCVSPDEALEGSSPALWARTGQDAERLARVALQDATRLSA